MPMAEFREKITARELTYWMAFFRLRNADFKNKETGSGKLDKQGMRQFMKSKAKKASK